MLHINGQRFSSSQFSGGSTQGYIESHRYGSRTAIGLMDAQTAAGGTFGLYARWAGSITASDDARVYPARWFGYVAFETLDLADGANFRIMRLAISNQSGSWATLDLNIKVKRLGSTYTLYLREELYDDELEIATVTEGTTYHKLELRIYLDKCTVLYDGVSIGDLTYSTEAESGYILDMTISFSSSLRWHLDDCWYGIQEADYSATANRSTTNGNPDDATIYIIRKDTIETAIAAGEAYQFDVADGSWTPSVADGYDYLVAKVLDGNDGGFALKLNYTDSAGWVTNEWSIS